MPYARQLATGRARRSAEMAELADYPPLIIGGQPEPGSYDMLPVVSPLGNIKYPVVVRRSSLGDSDPYEALFDTAVRAIKAGDAVSARAALGRIPAQYQEKVRARLFAYNPPLPSATLAAVYAGAGASSSCSVLCWARQNPLLVAGAAVAVFFGYRALRKGR